MKAQLSIISALVLGGLVACTSIAGAADKNGKKGDRKGANVEQRVQMLSTNLNLTAEQKTKVTELFEKDAKEIRAMREEIQKATPQERREKMKSRNEAMNVKMKEILKPEQYEKWLKLAEQRRENAGAEKKGEHKGQKKKNKE